MKSPIFGSVVLVAVVAAFAAADAQPAQPPPVKAGPHILKLTNGGKGAITAIYVEPAGTRDLSDDLLGKQTANAGKTVTLKVDDPKGDCVFDIQFLMSDGTTVTRKAVDLCQTGELAFTP